MFDIATTWPHVQPGAERRAARRAAHVLGFGDEQLDEPDSDSRIHWQLQPMRFQSHDVAASGLLDGCSRRCEVAILWDGMNLSFILYSHYIYRATNRNNNNR